MKIAIQGHPTRGKEIISLLESFGSIKSTLEGDGELYTYYIDKNNVIRYDYAPKDYKVYTLEEFEKEFPFKIGDKIKHITSIGIIKEYCYINNEPAYKVESMELGIIATIPAKILEPYKEMEERNITLTLEKAKEWYRKGGELKEIALQAFTEKELNPLPRSWEEFCEKHPIQDHEAFINFTNGDITICKECAGSGLRIWMRKPEKDRCKCVSQKSAEAHLALIQLEQLRDCWRQGWKPTRGESYYVIKIGFIGLDVYRFCTVEFLSFPTYKMAKEFLECFRDLIEKAGDLI